MDIKEQKLRDFIQKETNSNIDAFDVDHDLFSEFGLDSLEGLTLLAKIEKKFNILIPNESLADCRTLREILKHI